MLRFFKILAFGLLLAILGNVVSGIDGIQKAEENVGLWLLFNLRGPTQPPHDAVVVAIDRETSEQLNLPANPDHWPRSLHARLVDILHKAGAKVIVFDLYFLDRTSTEQDDALAAAIARAGNVVLAEQLKLKEISGSGEADDDTPGHVLVETKKPIELISRAAFGSAPFVLPRMPVRVGQYWTFQPSTGDMPTFPVMALQLYALEAYAPLRALIEKTNPQRAAEMPLDARRAIAETGAGRFMWSLRQVIRGDSALASELERAIASHADSNRLLGALVYLYTSVSRPFLNFYGPAQTVQSISYYKALQIGQDDSETPTIDLRGKAIFIGISERRLADARDSFHTVYSKARVFLTGVEIAATAFLNLLANSHVTPINTSQRVLTLFLWGGIVALICRLCTPLIGALAVLLCAGLYLFAAISEFRANTVWFPLVVPLFIQTPVGYFGALFWRYREINQERKRILTTLGYYLPEDLVTQVARDRVDIRKYGETVYGVCLFADVAGYTPVSEALAPRELSELMHKYLEATFAPIHKQGGLIVELKGDSILALWKGSPDESAFRANACAAALEMSDAVRRFNQASPAITLPTRISIHAGSIYLGNIGAGSHYEFGITGDTVTTAARLDGLNKFLGTNILVSSGVIHDLGGFLTRRCGTFIMKGKAQPVEAYELICPVGECTAKQKQGCAVFADAQSAFEAQRWDEAEEQLKRADSIFGGDKLARFYLQLCARYRATPPAQDWDGSIVMDEK